MKKLAILVFASATLLAGTSTAFAEKRCGWLENPSWGNWWLLDHDGKWIIREKDGYEAEGSENPPDISTGDYVSTNSTYGYACGCITGIMDADSFRVAQVDFFELKTVEECQADADLPIPDE
jgi:hypothetical protein